MCGIWLRVSTTAGLGDHDAVAAKNTLEEHEINNLQRRGPDYLGAMPLRWENHDIQLQASVLKMRSEFISQPVGIPVTSNGSYQEEQSIHLCWNGEVYQRLDTAGKVETVAGYDIADTQLVANMLQAMHNDLIAKIDDNQQSLAEAYPIALAKCLAHLFNAEYAFCLVTPWAIYYGRDPQGRRSLLYWDDATSTTENEDENPNDDQLKRSQWKLASVKEADTINNGNPQTWQEVVPGFVHEYRLVTQTFHTTPIPTLSLSKPSVPLASTNHPIPDGIPTTFSMWHASLALEHYLKQAVKLRICGSRGHDQEDDTTTNPSPKHVAVLFSGGVDSVVLAALALALLPTTEPLWLWNVSFTEANSNATAADCRAARASYEELLQLFPHHTLHYQTTTVHWDEMQQWESHIRNLLHPKTTTMDLNIAMALWFASRGRQRGSDGEHTADDGAATLSPIVDPKILLVGMGADEQLGGYGRHRKAYERAMQQETSNSIENGNATTTTSRAAANEELRAELDLDINRLWERNLGRDDRIFSDHGKEARFPYLDPHVMSFLKETPLQDICDYQLPPGQGDKRILRLVALRLGLTTASGMVKRAIQFGSRIAHVSDKRRFGSRRKAQGTAVV